MTTSEREKTQLPCCFRIMWFYFCLTNNNQQFNKIYESFLFRWSCECFIFCLFVCHCCCCFYLYIYGKMCVFFPLSLSRSLYYGQNNKVINFLNLFWGGGRFLWRVFCCGSICFTQPKVSRIQMFWFFFSYKNGRKKNYWFKEGTILHEIGKYFSCKQKKKTNVGYGNRKINKNMAEHKAFYVLIWMWMEMMCFIFAECSDGERKWIIKRN